MRIPEFADPCDKELIETLRRDKTCFILPLLAFSWGFCSVVAPRATPDSSGEQDIDLANVLLLQGRLNTCQGERSVCVQCVLGKRTLSFAPPYGDEHY